MDVYGNPVENKIDLTSVRRTRSGKPYNASALELCPILKNTTRTIDTTLVSYKPPFFVERLAHKRAIDFSVAHGLSQHCTLPGYNQPGHVHGYNVIRNENSERIVKLGFAEDLQVRFCITSGKEEFFFQRNQPLINREDLKVPITIFVMTGSIGVESSYKEFLYPTYWSNPMPSNDILYFETEDTQ